MIPSDLEWFQSVLTQRFGWRCDDERSAEHTATLRERVAATASTSVAHYAQRLADPVFAATEQTQIAAQLTVGETFFYRQHAHFDAFAALAVPKLCSAALVGARPRVVSAGCATGEDIYTLAMILRDRLGAGHGIELLGIDVNRHSLDRARRGHYSSWSMRECAVAIQERWLQASSAGGFQIAATLQQDVTFHERNLSALDADDGIFAAGSCEVIFCRNVFIYFTREAMAAAIARFATALRPGGYLFLGHAESLRGISNDFRLCNSHDGFFYQRLSGDVMPPTACPVATDVVAVPVAPINSEPHADWVANIANSARRVSQLDVPVAAVNLPSGTSPSNLGQRLRSLIAAEGYAEAQTLAATVSPDSAPREVLLAMAALAFVGHDLVKVEAHCRRLLGDDDLDPDAHFLRGLCRDLAGRPQEALTDLRAAVYLDPGFALPHFHLARLARQAGNNAAALQSAAAACALLPNEDDARVALFAGGFTRDALVKSCRRAVETGTP